MGTDVTIEILCGISVLCIVVALVMVKSNVEKHINSAIFLALLAFVSLGTAGYKIYKDKQPEYIYIYPEEADYPEYLELAETLYYDSIVECNDSILLEFLTALEVPHKNIVLAQAKLESGNYKSKLFKENNNLFGMKMPRKRYTLSRCSENGYAWYFNWQQSVIDYIIWQNHMVSEKLSDEEYLNYLQKIYAEDEGYKNQLELIISSLNSF